MMMVRKHALEGTRVLGFVWAFAAPVALRYLADHGAEVIKMESERRPDPVRLSPPFKDGIVGLDRSGRFIYPSAGLHSVTLDLSHPRGVEVAKRLVACSDVVVENFSPGVMKKIGLGYEELRKIKPDIIMVSSSIEGQNSSLAGWGALGAAMAAHYYLTGWPDREPTSMGAIGPGDNIQPLFTAALIMAALEHRSRTGKGQYIDIAQVESLIQFVTPAILDYVVNGRQQSRTGNRDPQLKARGAFVPLNHPVIGVCNHPAPPMKLSKTPEEVHCAACLGEHNPYVFTQVLGMSDGEFVELAQAGVFE